MVIETVREVKTLSPTSLSAWLRCRADWYNRYVAKTARSGSWNMMVGNAFHLGTYLMHSGKDWAAGVRDFWLEHTEILEAEDAPSLETVLTMLRVYQQMNPRHEGDQGEKYFKIDINGLSRPLTGIFDLLPGSAPGVVEFKTGGWWTQARADLAMQTIHYSLAYRELFGHVPEFFHFYAFDLQNVRVRRIKALVPSSEELDEFIPYLASLQAEMETAVIMPKCLLKDNNQTCWYPEECARILEEIRGRSIHVERITGSKGGQKRAEGTEVREGSEDSK